MVSMGNPNSPLMQLILHAPIQVMLWRLAAPNVVAVTIMTSVTFADAWFVGQLGTAALASLALVFPFQTLMQMMAGGAIGGGVTSAIARALGKSDKARAEAVAWHSIIIVATMILIYMIVLGVFPRFVFTLLGGTGDALEGAVLYARIAFGGAAAVWLVFVLGAILRGTGDTATPAKAVTVSSLAQLAMSGALTLGWGPLPSIGIAGPAVAMVVCQGAAALYLAAHLLRDHASIQLRVHTLRWQPVADVMQVGGIGLFNSLAIALTVATVTSFVGRYGTAALAGYGLGSRLELMLIPIAFGIGAALTAAVGANIGAGQYARARRIAWFGASIALVVTGFIGGVAASMPNLWLDRFTTDPGVYRFGALYLSVVAPFYGVFGAGQALYFASQGTGRMLLPVSVSVLRFLVVAGLCLLAVSFAWQVTAVFAAVSTGLVIIGVGMSLCVFGPAWRSSNRASV